MKQRWGTARCKRGNEGTGLSSVYSAPGGGRLLPHQEVYASGGWPGTASESQGGRKGGSECRGTSSSERGTGEQRGGWGGAAAVGTPKGAEAPARPPPHALSSVGFMCLNSFCGRLEGAGEGAHTRVSCLPEQQLAQGNAAAAAVGRAAATTASSHAPPRCSTPTGHRRPRAPPSRRRTRPR